MRFIGEDGRNLGFQPAKTTNRGFVPEMQTSNEPAEEPPKLQLLIGSHQTSAAKAMHTANMANRAYRQ
jgi:hypothetical protein